MTQRRSLVSGLQDTPDLKKLEKQFVYGGDTESADAPNELEESTRDDDILPQFKGRVPLTTRCRPELASALKRVSLKRQLAGKEPSSMQEIIEEAIEAWLRDASNGGN